MYNRQVCNPICAFLLAATAIYSATVGQGRVEFSGQPVPGAVVTATNDGLAFTAVTNERGEYALPELSTGMWTLHVAISGFAPMERTVRVSGQASSELWELTMLPLQSILGDHPSVVTQVPVPPTQTAGQNPARDEPAPETARQAEDGFLINGSVNNSAASPFGLAHAFGNDRFGAIPLYNGNVGFTFDNSVLDARAYSLTGQDTPKPSYSRFTGLASFGGPLRIPRILTQKGPLIVLNYQWTRNGSADTLAGLMPTAAAREGELSAPAHDPLTGKPFAANVIPPSRISPQALALLNLYPLPNFSGSAPYNYQVPVSANTHQDTWQARVNENVNARNQIFGSFSGQSIRTDSESIFRFIDRTDSLGLSAIAGWHYTFTPRLSAELRYQFTRFAQRQLPNYRNRVNVSGDAGIAGNDQSPDNWGPPSLTFSSGIANLSDAQSSLTSNQTDGLSSSWLWVHNQHNLTLGGEFRRDQFNILSQQNPRGSLTFTGAGTGNDLADFLLGIPDTSSLAFGNADKYLRGSSYNTFFVDDFRVTQGLSVNAGLRWDYSSPLSERYKRLVNLATGPGFTTAAPVVGNGLIQPDRRGFQPRIGLAWRPMPDSSTVVRAGYGIYDNTSIYLPIMTSMAQQPPLSKTFSVQDSPAHPLTLANAFTTPAGGLNNTSAIDPTLRVGYAQEWSFSVQRDLPESLVLTAAYSGSKGTRAIQEFLPNTYPNGAISPCPVCPSGFAYFTSNGNSTREAADLQIRRRLHNGLATSLEYTFSKSIDDASLGGTANTSGPAIAQNWLDLDAERAFSNFDQRHLLVWNTQYTSGMGASALASLTGWRAALVKQWTLLSQLTAASGLPETPIYFTAVNGTGFTGTVRPDYTGLPLYTSTGSRHLNPAAYAAPASGHWGNAGRNSITGPAQFVWNASIGRTFRVNPKINCDIRLDTTNPLNHVTLTNWNTSITSPQFGLPVAANAMRSVQTTVRFRF